MRRPCCSESCCGGFRFFLMIGLAIGLGAVVLVATNGCGEPGEPKAAEGSGAVEGDRLTAVEGKPLRGDGEKQNGDAKQTDAGKSSDTADKGDDTDNTDDTATKVAGNIGDNTGADASTTNGATGDDTGNQSNTVAATDGNATDVDNSVKNPKLPEPPAFVDPNNPNFIPPDRKAAANFDPSELKKRGDYYNLPFMVLAGYNYPTNIYVPAGPNDPRAEGAEKHEDREIPEGVRELDDKKVVIRGYMMPIDFEDGGTNEFILSRVIPSCFYCQPPQLNDWVEVKTKGGKRVPYYPDSPIDVYGTLTVSELIEDGFVVSLYRFEADKVEEVVNP